MPDHHRLPLVPRSDPLTVTAFAVGPASTRSAIWPGKRARPSGPFTCTKSSGLLTPAARSKGRFRLYTREALIRIRWIGKLQEMGFSLGDIQTIVREWERIASAPGAMKRMREVYARKLEETRAQKRRLEALEHELAASVEYLDTCDVCDPQRLLGRAVLRSARQGDGRARARLGFRR
jgi:DNA-binding transcriptional MerR regulator